MALDIRGLCPLLQVYDMPASVRFYRDTLGFELAATSPNLGSADKFHWCLLRLCGSELMLNTAYEFDDERPVPPDPARVAAHQDTCIYFAAPDVDAMYEELRAKGLQPDPPKLAVRNEATLPSRSRRIYALLPVGRRTCRWRRKVILMV